MTHSESPRRFRPEPRILIALIALGVLTLGWLGYSRANRGRAIPAFEGALFSTVAITIESGGATNSVATLQEAVEKAKPGDRIVLDGETLREHVSLPEGIRNVTIEGRSPTKSARVRWMRIDGGDDQPLLTISGASGLQLRGFDFVGDGGLSELVKVRGACPDTILEDLGMHNAGRQALTMGDCRGEPGKPIIVRRIQFSTKDAIDAAVGFDGKLNLWISILECRFEGPFKVGVKVVPTPARTEIKQKVS
jgi:hypothetical protein